MGRTLWMDNMEYEVGQIGFLVLRSGDRWSNIKLYSRPAHTNQSHEPRLYGWCGSTNNISVDARGLGRVVRIAQATERAMVLYLDQPEDAGIVIPWLAENGYPDLAEDWRKAVGAPAPAEEGVPS